MSQPKDAIADEYSQRLDWLLAPINRIARSKSLVTQPSTFVSRLGSKMEASLNKRIHEVGKEQVLKDLAGTWLPDSEWEQLPAQIRKNYEKARREAKRYPRGRALIDLLDRAHAAVPYCFFNVVPNPLERQPLALHAHGQLHKLKGLRGECRARQLWPVVGNIAESLYRPYLERIWKLAQYSQGKAPNKAPKFGAIAEALLKELGQDSPLIEKDCTHIRNAISHAHADYDPEAGVSVLREVIGWQKRYTTPELEKTARRMLEADEELWRILAEFITHSIAMAICPLYHQLVVALRNDDMDNLKVLSAEAESEFTILFSALYHVHNPSAAPVAASPSPQATPV